MKSPAQYYLKTVEGMGNIGQNDEPIEIMYFDEDQVHAKKISALIECINGCMLRGCFKDIHLLKNAITECAPDIVLIDLAFEPMQFCKIIKHLRELNPKLKILLYTESSDLEVILESIRYGANGYILKSTPLLKLIEAIEEVYYGGAPLSPIVARKLINIFRSSEIFDVSCRERDVLKLLIKGYSYKMISAELNIAMDTVRSHIRKIYAKLNVRSKAEVVVKINKEQLNYSVSF